MLSALSMSYIIIHQSSGARFIDRSWHWLDLFDSDIIHVHASLKELVAACWSICRSICRSVNPLRDCQKSAHLFMYSFSLKHKKMLSLVLNLYSWGCPSVFGSLSVTHIFFTHKLSQIGRNYVNNINSPLQIVIYSIWWYNLSRCFKKTDFTVNWKPCEKV